MRTGGKTVDGHNSEADLKYLRLLGEQYPTVEALCAEITRISAKLSLPKGTEHFMSDIHGEYEAFCHIMNNCSGVVREKVNLWLGDLSVREADELCTLIYYPAAILKQHHHKGEIPPEWYKRQTEHLIRLCRLLSSKYSREKVRRFMPDGLAFLLDELMHYQNDETNEESEQEGNRRRYHDAIIDALISTRSIDSLIEALTVMIKRLSVDRLHVVGDIFDRGPRADSIMDILMDHHSVDIEWGNHDILWMGAASGSECCIAGVLRNSISYGNMEILERGYGIPLRELTLYAEKQYPDLKPDQAMVQAVNVMMFKLEGQLILRNPEFDMEDRLLLDKIGRDRQTVEIDGKTWPMKPVPLPTVDPSDPYALTDEEAQVMAGLKRAFTHSLRLHEHIAFLYRRGWMYRAFNGNLLFHGCVPLNEDGSFLKKKLDGEELSGKALMDHADRIARRAFYNGDRAALDFMWYLWCGTDSPVCGRRVKTFARAFVPDERAWQEPRNPYYEWYNSESKCREILAEFGLTEDTSCIVNGHTPIRVTHGESPLKAGGKLVVIDGGFCRAYQKTTGIAGYTLISNSHGMRLMSHQPFTSLRDAQETGRDIHSQSFEFKTFAQRKYVIDTDQGRVLTERMNDLMRLLEACRSGVINLQR
ncbi:MAG: fructose-1,6-bisphosphatase [Clostridia bacterium]|nr:fructose-1,6-bisphosphatase [Clostridia bacterium]